MHTVEHWWNGVSGGHARRDVFLRTDGTAWEVELRHYPESSKRMRSLSEAEARVHVQDAMSSGNDPWERLEHVSRDQPTG